jgi:hypothetical protein
MHSGEEGKKTAARLPLCIEGKKKKHSRQAAATQEKRKGKKRTLLGETSQILALS